MTRTAMSATKIRRRWAFGSALALSLALAAPALAQQSLGGPKSFDIPRQTLSAAIADFSRQSDIIIAAPTELTAGRMSQAVKGDMSPIKALNQILAGTGIAAAVDDKGIVTLRRIGPGELEAGRGPAEQPNPEGGEQEIVVTGSRVKGAPPSSPVIVLTQQQIRRSGHNNVGEVIRSIPQNFNGGQNPGVAPRTRSGGDLTGGSTMNLRGLGPDATLTLLNGKRLAYDGQNQGVDVSVIPLEAVDRIEVVADGASAIYGSDAVAGVANIILKKEYDGIGVRARGGFATEGGGNQQQYSVTGGSTWSDGGIILTYDYEESRPIYARQREYLSYLADPYVILPASRRHNVLLSTHHALAPGLRLSIDALYGNRWSDRYVQVAQGTGQDRAIIDAESYTLSPEVQINVRNGWNVSATGVYSRNNSKTASIYKEGSVATETKSGYYNWSASGEVGAQGPAFTLPGGDTRLAIGAGYRYNNFKYSVPTTGFRIDGDLGSYYAYGEIFLPLLSPSQNLAYAHRLSISGALRHEKYADLGGVTTPKFGIIYAPTGGLELKGTWGKSFKAPTLREINAPMTAYIFPTETYGVAAGPAAEHIVAVSGARSGLKPERATSWTISMVVEPESLPGLRSEFSYFAVDYKDRVIIGYDSSRSFSFLVQSGSDAIILAPPANLVNDFLDRSSVVTNLSGKPFSPDQVYAIVDNRLTNVARQKIEGIDLATEYAFDLAASELSISGNMSWLRSKQQNMAGSEFDDLAGIVDFPAHFRGRAGVIWSSKHLTLSGFANYVGSLKNRRVNPAARVRPMTTFDMTALLRIESTNAFLRDVDLSISVHNLTNKDPSYVHPISGHHINYDSTNHSAVGRFISASIFKKF